MRNKSIFLYFILVLFLLTSATLASTETWTVTLYEGWNMISSPIGSPLEISEIEQSCTVTIIWHFNSSAQRFQNSIGSFGDLPQITQLYSDKGYWAYLNQSDPCIFTVEGAPRSSVAPLTLNPGWNMISNPTSAIYSVDDFASSCGDAVDPDWVPVFHFNGSASYWQYSLDSLGGLPKIETIESALGYYVQVVDSCTFNIGSDTSPVTSECHATCEDAGEMGMVSYSGDIVEITTCDVPKSFSDYHTVTVNYDGTVNFVLEPKTSDVDLYVYDDPSLCGSRNIGDIVCKSGKSGTTTDSCDTEAEYGTTYYIEAYGFKGGESTLKVNL